MSIILNICKVLGVLLSTEKGVNPGFLMWGFFGLFFNIKDQHMRSWGREGGQEGSKEMNTVPQGAVLTGP